MPRKIAAGNWKMNGTAADVAELDALESLQLNGMLDVIVCPPATLISQFAAASRSVQIGGQDCHANEAGAHTGDISAPMLASSGATHVIVGHSERRTDHKESDEEVAQKAAAAYSAGLVAIICIGETLEEREAGTTLDVLDNQLAKSLPNILTAANTIVAYEPVWAIGTGKVPTLDQIAEVHAHVRATVRARFDDGDEISILYGGSVKGSNAADIFSVAHVDGALVGGASLKAADFAPIVEALQKA